MRFESRYAAVCPERNSKSPAYGSPSARLKWVLINCWPGLPWGVKSSLFALRPPAPPGFREPGGPGVPLPPVDAGEPGLGPDFGSCSVIGAARRNEVMVSNPGARIQNGRVGSRRRVREPYSGFWIPASHPPSSPPASAGPDALDPMPLHQVL